MIIELSKKDFRSMLLKMDLDKETRFLVEEKRSYEEIRDSLIKNINSDNVILYRKLIKKAEEEEENLYDDDEEIEEQPQEDYSLEDEEEQDLFDLEQEPKSGKFGYKQLKDIKVGEANIKDTDVAPMKRTLDSNLETSKEKSKILKVNAINKTYSLMQVIENYISGLNNLVNNLNVKVVDDKLKINRKREYDVLTRGSVSKSNQIINMLNTGLNNYNFLVKEYKGVLDKKGNSYVISKRTYDKENNRIKRQKQQINVTDLQNEIKDLLDLELPEGSPITFSILEILEKMHTETHRQTPSLYRSKSQRLEELTSLGRYIKGRNPSAERSLETIRKDISNLNNFLDELEKGIKATDKLVEDLKELKKESLDNLISYRLDKINKFIREILNQSNKIPVNKRKKIQEKLKEVTEEKINLQKLRENPIYIEEIKRNIIEDLEKDIDRLIKKSLYNSEKLKEYIPDTKKGSLRESLGSLNSSISKLIFIQNEMSEELKDDDKKLTNIPKNISDSIISTKNLLNRFNRLVNERIADFKKDLLEGQELFAELSQGENLTQDDLYDLQDTDNTEEIDNKLQSIRNELQEKINVIVKETDDYYKSIDESTSGRL